MQITISNTSKVVELNGVPARAWEGETSSGVKVICFVSRIAVANEESKEVHEQFAKELSEVKAPSIELQKFPLRMII